LLSGPVYDLRIGLNSISAETKDFVWSFCSRVAVPCYVYQPPQNVGKYPLMRRMFYDQARPLGERVIWFDDDSYMLAEAGSQTWWGRVGQLTRSHPVVGQLWTIRQRGEQYRHIQQQPWYGGMPVLPNHVFRFATGGWWIADSTFLSTWDYPFRELYHNGGDSILGELVRQQRRTLGKFSDGVIINEGRVAGRRGIGSKTSDIPEIYIWQHGPRGDFSQHNFVCEVTVFRNREMT